MGRLWWSWTMTAAQLTVSQFTSASISSVISIALTAIHVLDCTLAVHTRTISTLGPCCHRVFFTIKFHSNGGHQPKAPKRHEYATYLSQYFQCSKLHTSTQDTVYQSTVIPLEVCCSTNEDPFCPLHLVSNFYMFELRIYGNILLCIASWKYVNPSIVSAV